jgi:hypothetical protein
MNFVLAILYAPAGQRALSVARVHNHSLLAAAAEEALSESESVQAKLMGCDANLGALQREEAAKLRRVLSALVNTPHVQSVRHIV